MERKFKVVYTEEPIDLTLLAQAFAKQFLKETIEDSKSENNNALLDANANKTDCQDT